MVRSPRTWSGEQNKSKKLGELSIKDDFSTASCYIQMQKHVTEFRTIKSCQKRKPKSCRWVCMRFFADRFVERSTAGHEVMDRKRSKKPLHEHADLIDELSSVLNRYLERLLWLSPYGVKFTVTVLEQVWVPASHTLYMKLAWPLVPVESSYKPSLGVVAITTPSR